MQTLDWFQISPICDLFALSDVVSEPVSFVVELLSSLTSGGHTKLTLLYSSVLYCTLQNSTGLYCTLQNSTALYWTLLDSTGLYWTLLDSTGLYWTLLDSTGLYWTHLNSPGLTWTHLDSTGLTWTLLDSTALYWTLLAWPVCRAYQKRDFRGTRYSAWWSFDRSCVPSCLVVEMNGCVEPWWWTTEVSMINNDKDEDQNRYFIHA